MLLGCSIRRDSLVFDSRRPETPKRTKERKKEGKKSVNDNLSKKKKITFSHFVKSV